jgi:hypothetical protein
MQTVVVSGTALGVLSVCSFVRGEDVDVNVWFPCRSGLAFLGVKVRHKTNDGTLAALAESCAATWEGRRCAMDRTDCSGKRASWGSD